MANFESFEAAIPSRGSQIDIPRRSRTELAQPTSFRDILPPESITTSTLSEAGYLGYRKSRFKSWRSSTFPAPATSKLQLEGTAKGDEPTSRRSTIKRMRGAMQSIRRSLTSSKPKNRPTMPTQFGTNKRTRRAQGYEDIDSDDERDGN